MFTHDEKIDIHINGQRFGGSFAKALTDALIKADLTNQRKLENEFSELFLRYLNFNK